jgi:hypothetical protein
VKYHKTILSSKILTRIANTVTIDNHKPVEVGEDLVQLLADYLRKVTILCSLFLIGSILGIESYDSVSISLCISNLISVYHTIKNLYPFNNIEIVIDVQVLDITPRIIISSV